MMRRLLVPLTAFLFVACATVVREEPRPAASRGRGAPGPVALGIPPGHLPGVGQCRIWIPGVPPGRQRPPRACAGIVRAAPPGSWIVYRPARDRRLIHVRAVDDARVGTRVVIRVYGADGRFLREEHLRLEESFDEDERPRGGRGRPQ